MISAHQALALRRLLLAGFGLAATLVAHAACAPGVGITLAAPMVWGSLACLAVVAGPRWGARWREWTPAGLLLRLAAVELALHLALTVAPWAFGITVHHPPPLASPSVLLVHGVVVLLFGAALLGAQRLLTLAVRLIRAVRRALHLAAAPAAPPRPAAVHGPALAPLSLSWPPRGARGPPVRAS